MQFKRCKKVSEVIGGSSPSGHGVYVYRLTSTSSCGGMAKGFWRIVTWRESYIANCDTCKLFSSSFSASFWLVSLP